MEKRLRVFRRHYDRLKDGFSCCTEISTVLYSKGLITADVRDTRDPERVLSAVERVLPFQQENWDTLLDIMADPPLDSLAKRMMEDLERIQDDKPSSDGCHPTRSAQVLGLDPSPEHHSSNPPDSLTFGAFPNSPPIDSGTWTSEKYKFPSNYFGPESFEEGGSSDTESSLNKKPDRNDSGVHIGCSEVNDELPDDENEITHRPHIESTSKGQSFKPSEAVKAQPTTNTPLKSELVGTQKVAKKKSSSNIVQSRSDVSSDMLKMKIEQLKNEISRLQDDLKDSKEETTDLLNELEFTRKKWKEDQRLLENKLKQLGDDNHTLSEQIEAKRHLESENRRLHLDVKHLKAETERYKRDVDRLRSSLEMAERNATIQVVNIDKLRDKIASQEALINELQSKPYHHWVGGADVSSFDCTYTDVDSDDQYESLTSTGMSQSPAYY